MKCLILLVLAALANASPYHYYSPAPKVSDVAKAYAAAAGPYYPYHGYSSYHLPVVSPDGYVADTPEVGAAKLAHYAEKARASYPYYYRSYPYYYPYY